MALNHCLICTGLDGCYFCENIMPEFPQHSKCDCKKKRIQGVKVKNLANVYCDVNKFLKYVFSDKGKSCGKKDLFESFGYNIYDSYSLKQEYEKQAIEKYLDAEYILKNLDFCGQRIAIEINLKGNMFLSGWIVEPEGKIRNTTPFGGWIK